MPLPDIVPLHLIDAFASSPEASASPTKENYGDPPTYAEIEEALRHLPAHFGANSYDTWLGILMAVHTVLGDAGIELCERYIPGEKGEIAGKFASFDPNGKTKIGTLIKVAKERGYKPPKRSWAAEYEEDLPELPADEIDALMKGQLPKVLPEIQVNNRQLSHVIVDLKHAMQQRNSTNAQSPIVLKRGGILVRTQGESIQSVTLSGLNGIASEVARWIHTKPGKDDLPPIIIDVFPPRDVVSTYLGADDWPELPELKGLLTAPTYVGQGRWVDSPGYDTESGLFLACAIDHGDTVPVPENVAWAIDILANNLLNDFPFKDDASRAHAIAFVLLPFVRHTIDGPVPMTLVDAPEKGTGKSLLVTACGIPALGTDVPSMTLGNDDEEIRKRLTALLQKGTAIISFDNIAGKLDSAPLAVALTQTIWEDRQLGSTHMLRLPIRTIWAATANNAQPSDEIARRCVWVRLDASMERPSERTGFRHPDLLAWAKAHRPDLIRAAMILVNNWAKLGEPAGNYVKGSFQAWANTIGGILDAANIPGFLANERELFNVAVSDLQLWGAFVESWANAHNHFWVTTKDLFGLASHYDTTPSNGPDGLGLLDDILGSGNERSRQTRLGKQLGQMTDRVIRGWKIERGSINKGYQQWRLSRITSQSDDEGYNADILAGGVDVVDPTSTPDLPEVGENDGGRRGTFQPLPHIDNGSIPNLEYFSRVEVDKMFTTSTNVHPHTGRNGVDVAIQCPPHDQTSTPGIEDLGL